MTSVHLPALLLCFFVPLCLCGESSFSQPVTKIEWKPIEEGVADRTSISRSLKLEPLELRKDSAFERVYELSPSLRILGHDHLLARRAGDTTAIFPQSVYTNTPRGQYAERPGGTIFLIGDIGANRLDSKDDDAPSLTFIDLAADMRPSAERPKSPARPASAPTIWTDDTHRAQRIGTLLSLATRM